MADDLTAPPAPAAPAVPELAERAEGGFSYPYAAGDTIRITAGPHHDRTGIVRFNSKGQPYLATDNGVTLPLANIEPYHIEVNPPTQAAAPALPLAGAPEATPAGMAAEMAAPPAPPAPYVGEPDFVNITPEATPAGIAAEATPVGMAAEMADRPHATPQPPMPHESEHASSVHGSEDESRIHVDGPAPRSNNVRSSPRPDRAAPPATTRRRCAATGKSPQQRRVRHHRHGR